MVKRGKTGVLSMRTTQGVDKEYRIPMPRHSAQVWRATGEGNIEEVSRLLGKITSVGKKRSIGYGIVKDWQIREIPEFSLFDAEGKALRPIPVGYLKQFPFDIQYCAWTPPYWLGASMTMCMPIGANYVQSVQTKPSC